jgi:hypothetical protein
MSKPNPHPDLDARFAAAPAAAAAHKLAIVKWWKRVDDPALISLGGGIVTVTVGRISAIDETDIHLLADDLPAEDMPQAFTKTIPRTEVLDLRFAGEPAEISGEFLHKLAIGEAA